MKYNKVLLNVPHSSIERCYEGWYNTIEFNSVVKKYTDWYTDLLFSSEKATMVRFPFSRFFCDVERVVNDPSEKNGEGIIYFKKGDFKRYVDENTKLECLKWYDVHRNILSEQIVDNTIIIDCHSFQSDESIIDICVGLNDDWSKPDDETIDNVCNIFEGEGYTVGINCPRSGSVKPTNDRNDYHSMMISMNKRIYMDEKTNDILIEPFSRLKNAIDKVYEYLLNN